MRTRIILACAAILPIFAIAQQTPPAAQPSAPKPALESPAAPGTTPITLPPEAVVLTIGSEKMTRAQFEELLAALAANGRPVPNAAAKRQLAKQLGELHSVALEARKRKIDQAAATKQLLTIQVDQVLANELQRQVAGELKVDDAEARAYYDSHKGQYEQIKAYHILIRFKGSQVPTKPNEKDLSDEEALAKAKEIHKKLVDGGDFAAIAKAESDDTGTAAAGGALPPFARGQMVKEFEDAVYSQPIGQISDPVKTKYGYHIIKVEERKSKTLEEVRADIDKQLKQQLLREAMDRIERETPVTLDETYFGK
jgi:parvulin-like peptidyl-prolyl isomerase